MNKLEAAFEHRYRVLESSVRELRAPAEGAYQLACPRRPFPLTVEGLGPDGPTFYSRDGQNGNIAYHERLHVWNLDPTLRGVTYYFENDVEGEKPIVNTGRELLQFDMPAGFILDLAEYAGEFRRQV